MRVRISIYFLVVGRIIIQKPAIPESEKHKFKEGVRGCGWMRGVNAKAMQQTTANENIVSIRRFLECLLFPTKRLIGPSKIRWCSYSSLFWVDNTANEKEEIVMEQQRERVRENNRHSFITTDGVLLLHPSIHRSFVQHDAMRSPKLINKSFIPWTFLPERCYGYSCRTCARIGSSSATNSTRNWRLSNHRPAKTLAHWWACDGSSKVA